MRSDGQDKDLVLRRVTKETHVSEEVHIHCCSHVGVSGTTDVVTRQNSNGTWEARVGVSMIGTTNMEWEDIERINNPFSDEWEDNFARGTGATEAEAIDALKKDVQSLADSLWAF